MNADNNDLPFSVKPKASAKKPQNPAPSGYTAKDIEVLEGLEPVRKRPGMYIGGTDSRAMHHLMAEVLDNAMDEVIAGYASKIEVEIHQDGFISIRDDGRGIPTDPHPKFPDRSALEVILTTLHSGGKFHGKVYGTAGGLHGVGISVVNALSDALEIEVWRERNHWVQSYSRGHAVSQLGENETSVRRRGTRVRFHPDPQIFGDLRWDSQTLWQMVRAKAYLFKGATIHWVCHPSLIRSAQVPAKAVVHYPNGLGDYLRDRIGSGQIIYCDAGAFGGGNTGKVEWALGWPDPTAAADGEDSQEDGESFLQSYCNTIPTPQGGTHETGVRQALLRSFREYGERLGRKGAQQITVDDILAATSCVVSAFIEQPQFQGQTKEKLVSAEASKLVEGAMRSRLDHWLVQNTAVSQLILQRIIDRAEERLAKKQGKDVARAAATRRLRLPGKLTDCTSGDVAKTEIFLVEGDSAGGSAKQARDRLTQAILPLKGKILNVATATSDKMNANQELKDLATALGCGSGKGCDPSKLRYGRVIIMTDADVDGAHIASLLLTFFFREMYPLLEGGRIYLARPPLYRLTAGSESAYAIDEAERERLLKTRFARFSKVDVSRFKGLGEMSPGQLKSTTMDPHKRILLQVCLKPDSADGIYGGDLPGSGMKGMDSKAVYADLVDRLMGKKSSSRLELIQRHAPHLSDRIDI